MSNLGELDTKVRQWLKGARLSVIVILLEAIRDELESRDRTSASAVGHSGSGRRTANGRSMELGRSVESAVYGLYRRPHGNPS